MTRTLNIAQVAPLIEPVPPPSYGGTERVVANLTDALIEAGHRVTLFASGDSTTRARLVEGSEKALRAEGVEQHAGPLHQIMLEAVYRRASDFDVIHAHLDAATYPFARRSPTPTVTTLHGRLDLPMLPQLYREYSDISVVSISDAQRGPLPARTRWAATIYHGLDRAQYTCADGPGEYLAFLGRISPEKRVDSAIRVARQAGWPLKIAAKVDRVDREYFDTEIAPMLEHPSIEFLGEIGEADKQEFLGGAAALMFMVDWPEPFGLAMIEAMACGTPVIARNRGSVPEVVDEGVTGFICEDEAEAVAAVEHLKQMDRRSCRHRFEERFSREVMAGHYVDVYRELIEAKHSTASDRHDRPSSRPS